MDVSCKMVLLFSFFHFSESLDNVLKMDLYLLELIQLQFSMEIFVIFSTRISITPNTLHWQRLYLPSSWCWFPFFYWTCWLPWWVTLIKWSLPNQKRNGENRLVLYECKFQWRLWTIEKYFSLKKNSVLKKKKYKPLLISLIFEIWIEFFCLKIHFKKPQRMSNQMWHLGN